MPNSLQISSEAQWLLDCMNSAGLSNAGLHESLQQSDWEGQPNNIANWRSGASRIPSRLVPLIVRATGQDPELGEGKAEVIRFFRNRYPFLRPYLQETQEAKSLKSASHKRGTPTPVYYARQGALQGKRFVPHRNRDGRFVAGTSRFEKDQQTFSTLDELVEALRSNPDLKVRMACEDGDAAPPSLIQQRSLAWE